MTVRRVSSALSGHLAGDGTKPAGSQLLPNLVLNNIYNQVHKPWIKKNTKLVQPKIVLNKTSWQELLLSFIPNRVTSKVLS